MADTYGKYIPCTWKLIGTQPALTDMTIEEANNKIFEGFESTNQGRIIRILKEKLFKVDGEMKYTFEVTCKSDIEEIKKQVSITRGPVKGITQF